MWEISDICEQSNQMKIAFMKKLDQSEVRQSLQSIGTELFAFQFAIQKYKV